MTRPLNIALYMQAGQNVMERRRPSERELMEWIDAGAPDLEPSDEDVAELWEEFEAEYERLLNEEY